MNETKEVIPTIPKSGAKIDFGNLTKKESATKSKEYPVAPDPNGQLAQIAARIREREPQLKALDGARKTDKADLRCHTARFFFEHNHGLKADEPESVIVRSPAGDVLVSYTSALSSLDEEKIQAALGDKTDTYFRQAFTIEIDGDALGDQAQEIVNELQNLFQTHGCLGALVVKATLTPRPDFHLRRHTELTVEENPGLDQVAPIKHSIRLR